MEWEVIFGQVISKANHYSVGGQGSRHWIIKDPIIRKYESSFRKQCKIYASKGISSRFKLEIKVYHSSIRFDLDNALKTVLDCLQDCGAITNDSQCFSIEASKFIDKFHPRIEYRIIEICEQKELF